MVSLKSKSIRPVKCLFCRKQMFYREDPKYKPEVRLTIDFDFGMVTTYYSHLQCWAKAIRKRRNK